MIVRIDPTGTGRAYQFSDQTRVYVANRDAFAAMKFMPYAATIGRPNEGLALDECFANIARRVRASKSVDRVCLSTFFVLATQASQMARQCVTSLRGGSGALAEFLHSDPREIGTAFGTSSKPAEVERLTATVGLFANLVQPVLEVSGFEVVRDTDPSAPENTAYSRTVLPKSGGLVVMRKPTTDIALTRPTLALCN